MTRHTAIYTRLSPRSDGRSEGVDVQERQGRAYAATAWPGVPVVVYEDRLLSAADETWRPGYEKLRQAVRDGDVAHVWCVEQSRLQRREVGWFELAAELVTAGITEVHTVRDGIVRVADDISGIKAVLAAGEIRKLKMRINDRLADNAARGLAPGSLPFGYAHAVDGQGGKTYVIVPEQAAAIRVAADRVLAGVVAGERCRRHAGAGPDWRARRETDRRVGPVDADQADDCRAPRPQGRHHRPRRLGADPG